jgi:hypothetical protein
MEQWRRTPKMMNRLYDTLVDGGMASSITLHHVAIDWSTYHRSGMIINTQRTSVCHLILVVGLYF